MTQKALSKLTGVAQGFISEIENGSKTGDVQTLAAVATALEMSLDDLVKSKPPPFPNPGPERLPSMSGATVA